jgi:hypothetical protein
MRASDLGAPKKTSNRADISSRELTPRAVRSNSPMAMVQQNGVSAILLVSAQKNRGNCATVETPESSSQNLLSFASKSLCSIQIGK